MPFMFSPPGNITDLSEALLAQWDKTVSDYFEGAISKATPQFYSEKRRVTRPTAKSVPIQWNGYPRRIGLFHPGRFTDAEQLAEFNKPDPAMFPYPMYQDVSGRTKLHGVMYRPQDEYLEWHVSRDDQGRIMKVTFTAEPPDYWMTFFNNAEKEATTAIGELTKTTGLKPDDLRAKTDMYAGTGQENLLAVRGQYNPNNDAVTKNGIAHLTHQSNTLGAEISLAAGGSVRYAVNGSPIREQQRLVCCAGFGEPSRSSDPTIGFAVNNGAWSGAYLTLTNPVGLYIGEMDTGHITHADGSPTDPTWFKVIRGDGPPGQTARIVRAEYTNPQGFVSDLLIDGDSNNPITTGGQLAALVTMHLFATVDGTDAPAGPERKCQAFCCENTQGIFVANKVGEPACSGDFNVDPFPNDHTASDEIAEYAAAVGEGATNEVRRGFGYRLRSLS